MPVRSTARRAVLRAEKNKLTGVVPIEGRISSYMSDFRRSVALLCLNWDKTLRRGFSLFHDLTLFKKAIGALSNHQSTNVRDS